MEFTNPEEENNIIPEPVLYCQGCSTSNATANRFCVGCGTALQHQYSYKYQQENEGIIKQLIVFFVCLVLIIALYGYSELFEINFTTSLITDGALAILVTVYAVMNRQQLVRLYNLLDVKISPLIIISGLMVITAIGVHFASNYINNMLYGETGSSLAVYQETAYPLLFSILFIGVYPAVFEELAFRGFVYNYIERFTSARSAIAVTGLLFALIHFSFLSLGWYIPLGLFFGWLRYKYQNMWYSMTAHFIYNSTIVGLEFMGY